MHRRASMSCSKASLAADRREQRGLVAAPSYFFTKFERRTSCLTMRVASFLWLYLSRQPANI